jgi:predicted ribosome quality control (RQC) complex YloA/Tae2 family protein
VKSWTVSEINGVVSALKPLVGLRLQEVQTSPQDVVLGFYSPNGMLWLWIDLNAISPCLLPWTELPLRPQIAKTPLQLFLKAHFVDKSLQDIETDEKHGRVVILRFGQGIRLELRLFPHGRNLIAHATDKSIAWQKPQELTEADEHHFHDTRKRSLEQLREEWLAQKGKSKSVRQKSADPKAKLQNDADKKRKALVKVEEELKRKQDLPWKAVGTWLKTHQSLEVPLEFEPFVDKRRKLSWNIEQCFTKARESDGKILGTEKRLQTLHNEIAAIEQRLAGPVRDMTTAAPLKAKPSLGDMDAQGRTLRLPGDLVVVAGKSAADNMKILRKARAWDLWFHMKDVPSSHAVLFRNKNAKVGDSVLHEVAAWFVRNHLGPKAAQHVGEKFALVVAECRHVKPIKGDKLGRVTFHEERTFVHKL